MNTPPVDSVRVCASDLRSFAEAALKRAGLRPDDARLTAGLIAAADLRGVASHGMRQLARYVRELRNGELNASPDVRVAQETETTAVIDADGGLGYVPAWRGMHLAVDKAKRLGVAVVLTRNHGHIGAAGHYSRVAAAADCVGVCMSGARGEIGSDHCVVWAGGGSPISFAMPNGAEPPLVPDMGTAVYVRGEEFVDLFGRLPDVFFKFLGLATTARVLGALLPGMLGEHTAVDRFACATQGAFLAAVDVSRFMPAEEFRRQMDALVAQAGAMRPFPGADRAELPGGLEARREREYSSQGVPLSRECLDALDALAVELGMAALSRAPVTSGPADAGSAP